MDVSLTLLSAVFLYLIQLCDSNDNVFTFERHGIKIEKLKVPKTCDFSAEDDDILSIHCK